MQSKASLYVCVVYVCLYLLEYLCYVCAHALRVCACIVCVYGMRVYGICVCINVCNVNCRLFNFYPCLDAFSIRVPASISSVRLTFDKVKEVLGKYFVLKRSGIPGCVLTLTSHQPVG